jgi:hypothetical protein
MILLILFMAFSVNAMETWRFKKDLSTYTVALPARSNASTNLHGDLKKKAEALLYNAGKDANIAKIKELLNSFSFLDMRVEIINVIAMLQEFYAMEIGPWDKRRLDYHVILNLFRQHLQDNRWQQYITYD